MTTSEAAAAGAPPIGIWGPMGVGKTTVGRLLAVRLGRTFVDADQRLAERLGKPIARIFAEDGEPAFRSAERVISLELMGTRDVVVAFGGGALVDGAVRDPWQRQGTLACLRASAATLRARIGHEATRPLAAKLDALLTLRREAYDSLVVQELAEAPLEVVVDRLERRVRAEERLWRRAGARRTVQSPGGPYPLWIGRRLLDELDSLLTAIDIPPGPVVLVTNEALAPHRSIVEAALARGGYDTVTCMLPAGEAHKTFRGIEPIHDACVRAGLSRERPILALGGGIVGDMAGFAAATFMRGIPVVQIPTTLLAMVDSSVGGKTGVDLPGGKNLVGAFHPPRAVLIDVETLRTLPDAELRSGMAEVLKHGLLGDRTLVELIERAPSIDELLDEALLARAIDVKIRIVEEDPYEQGKRALLNLGHTFGHALERVSNYSMRHGDAVAVGLVAATRLSVALGLAPPALAVRVQACVALLGLPFDARGHDVDALVAAMSTDKKKTAGRLRFIALRDLEEALVIEPVPEVVRAVWQSLTSPSVTST